MLYRELLAQREVELVLIDERLREVRGELGVPGHFGKRPRTEAFVADRVALRDTEREGGVFVKAEIGGVIVIDDDRDIGLELRQPFAYRHVGIEERLPGRLLRAAAVDYRADRRHVREPNPADDCAHQRAPRILRVARNCS